MVAEKENRHTVKVTEGKINTLQQKDKIIKKLSMEWVGCSL